MTNSPSATSAARLTICGPKPADGERRQAEGIRSGVEGRRHQGVRGELATEVERLPELP